MWCTGAFIWFSAYNPCAKITMFLTKCCFNSKELHACAIVIRRNFCTIFQYVHSWWFSSSGMQRFVTGWVIDHASEDNKYLFKSSGNIHPPTHHHIPQNLNPINSTVWTINHAIYTLFKRQKIKMILKLRWKKKIRL